jgi:uncharacterized repeat protein (TIGR04052 family)
MTLVVRLGRSGLVVVSATALFAGCPGPADDAPRTAVAVSFAARVGDEPFDCTRTYAGVGTSGSTLVPVDLRFFVHGVSLLLDDSAVLPVALDDDGEYQDGTTALVDVEDGRNSCADQGNAGRHDIVTGTVAGALDPSTTPFAGVRFTLGVPFAANHENPATAPPPRNELAMSWNWQGGLKFLKLDAQTTGQPGGYFLHVGSTGCDGDPATGNVTACAAPNRVDVELTGFDPTATPIGVDLGALLSGSDVDVDGGGAPGCMAQPTDPDCAPIFSRLGLPWGDAPAGPQSFFVAP